MNCNYQRIKVYWKSESVRADLQYRLHHNAVSSLVLIISIKTIDRAKQNLAGLQNVTLICDDFMTHEFIERFDVIYSSLTFMYKLKAINKLPDCLRSADGLFCQLTKIRMVILILVSVR